MDLPIPLPPSRWEGGSFCLRVCLTYLLSDAILVSSAPSHREGGSFCLRICLACLLPDAILVSSAPSHREGAARRAWIGRRVRWQSLGTYETDYDLRRQKTALSHSWSASYVPYGCLLMNLPIPLPPSRWEGGSFCLRICLAYLLPDAILVSSAPAHREGAARRAGDRETGALAVARHI